MKSPCCEFSDRITPPITAITTTAMEVTLERFSRTMDKLFRPPYPALVCVAVSGGVDSMALTHLACRYFVPKGVGVRALIVDHALRAESAEEADRVRGLTEAMGAQARVLRMHWAPGELARSMARFELAARDKRLSLLSQECRDHSARNLLFAHTQDDQLETMLMRLTRGSSLRGLAGMQPAGAFWRIPPPPQREQETGQLPLRLVKPLLEYSKNELYATCQARGVEWVEDPTNHDATFTLRNAIRQTLKDDTLLPMALQRQSLVDTLDEFQRKRDDFEQEARDVVRALISTGGATGDETFGRVTFREFSGLRNVRTSALALALQHVTARIAPFEGDGYTFSIFFRIAERIKQVNTPHARFSAGNLDWMMTSRMQVSEETGGVPQQTCTWKVVRQKPPRWSTGGLKSFRPKMAGDWTPYTLFDNRYWVRVRILGGLSTIDEPEPKEARKYMKLSELKKYLREKERLRQQQRDRQASAYRTVVVKYPGLRINDREFLDKCLPQAESGQISAAVRAQVKAKMLLVQPTVFVHKHNNVPLGYEKEKTGIDNDNSSKGRKRVVQPEEDPTNYELVGCPLLLGAATRPSRSIEVPVPESPGLRLEIECRLKEVGDENESDASLQLPLREPDQTEGELAKHMTILQHIKF